MSWELDKITKQIAWLEKAAQSSFSTLSKWLAWLWIVAWFKNIAGWVITLAWNLQQATVAFTTMLWSWEKAKDLLMDLTDFAKKTPFEITGIRSTARQLLAVWVTVEEMIPTLKSLWDVSAWLSVPIERLAANFWQVKAQGKLTGRELRDFSLAWVPLIAELAKNLWVAENEIMSMVSASKIWFADVEEAFRTMSSEWGKFENLMDAQSKTFQGTVSNMKDNISQLWETIWWIFLPWLTSLVNAIVPVIGAIWEWAKENQEAVKNIIIATGALVWLIWVVTILIPIVKTLWLVLSSNPIWLLITVVYWLYIWLNLLNSAIKTSDQLIQHNKNAILALNRAYQSGTIDQKKYEEELRRLKIEMVENKLKANWLGNEMKWNLKTALGAITSPIKWAKQAFQDFKTIIAAVKTWLINLRWQVKAFIINLINSNPALKAFADNFMTVFWLILKYVNIAVGGIVNWISKLKSALWLWWDKIKASDIVDSWWFDNMFPWLDISLKETKDKISTISAPVNEVWGVVKDLAKDFWDAFDYINEWLDESIWKIEWYQKEIEQIQESMKELWVGETKDVASEYVKIKEEIAKINEELNIGWVSQEKQLELIQQRKLAQDAMASAFSWLSEEERLLLNDRIAYQEKYNEMNSIEKIKEDYAIKKAEMQAELDAKILLMDAEFEKIKQLEADKIKLENDWMVKLRLDNTEQITMYNQLIQKARELASARARAWMWGVSWARALWWPVNAWETYLVWERWPELFVPSTKWSITPNNAITNNNWISINLNWITVRTEADIEMITDEIIRKIKLEKQFWIV